MYFFNDIFHNLALLEFYFLNIFYILLYIEFILSIFFQHSNILTRASHHWCLASNIVLVCSVSQVNCISARSNCSSARYILYPRSHFLNTHSLALATAVPLTHWSRDEIDAISQTTYSNAFSLIKMNEFRLRLHWSVCLGFELTISQHWFR